MDDGIELLEFLSFKGERNFIYLSDLNLYVISMFVVYLMNKSVSILSFFCDFGIFFLSLLFIFKRYDVEFFNKFSVVFYEFNKMKGYVVISCRSLELFGLYLDLMKL